MDDNKKMKWQKDLETFYPIYNSFLFEGYIDDDQPYEDENGEVKYCRLYDYFDKVYSNHPDRSLRKRVIIYDLTESEDKRFKICDEDYVQEFENPSDEEGGATDAPPKSVIRYMSSQLSQHFWDIVHDSELDKLLIDHKQSGPSLDFSRIHFAVTEGSGRVQPFEILEKFREAFERLFGGAQDESEPSGYLFVIKMSSRLLSRDGSSAGGLNPDELMIFRQLLNIAQSLDADNNTTGSNDNKLVILANKLEDLPKWFVDESTNPYIKFINISRPSEENILSYFHEMLEHSNCFTEQFLEKYYEIDRATKASDPQAKRNPIEKKFLAYTTDFGMKALRKYRSYLERQPMEDPAKLGFSISTFQLGDMTNPWDDDEIIRQMLNIAETVKQKIKGQDHALNAAQLVLTRAAIGLDRAENPNAPRVVLFLAGPTGTGKTELCKQLAECVFGSEDRIVRFDMSEYGQEESDQKLFGAPPGYIGYEEGGKLTNAIKKQPFSLVLFDEIEKAHNSILDKFLQILGDGRLTDGKGETVRFTDSIIVITSNAGVTKLRRRFDETPEDFEERVNEEMGGDAMPEGKMNMEEVIKLEEAMVAEGKTDDTGKLTREALDEIYDAVREHLRYNVKSYFHCKLGRPELYGRIEDSIVYYNYIGRESVSQIVEGKINGVIKSTKEARSVAEVVCSVEVFNAITAYCQKANVRALGARGIIKSTGKLFSGSLSSFLSPYVRGVDGKDKNQLVGKTLTCTCGSTVETEKDITWSISNG